MRPILMALLLMAAACTQASEPVATSTTTPTTTSAPGTTIPRTTAPTDPTTTTTLGVFHSLSYRLVGEIDFPVQLSAAPGGDIAYLATKDGRIWAFEGGVVASNPALDISGRVLDQGEQGLLSIALHPDDPGRLFVHYTATNGDTIVAEYSFVDPHTVNQDSERILLRLDQPAGNHNGGMVQFGPDGALYVGLGDGGGANDQFGHGQNRNSLLGGLVSLRVDGEPEPALYAIGLRNPWRFWIDEGLIYIADVGQNSFEEVSVTPLEPGLNFGWPIMEGIHCFNLRPNCDQSGLVLPVVTVSHDDSGTCSITGGVVYRGADIPEIYGHYFYSDYCGGYLRSFRYHDGELVDETDWTDQVGVPGQVVGFGVDGRGEMYVATTAGIFEVVAVRG